MQLLVLVLGSRTSNPHLLLAQAQAQAAQGIQKTGNHPEDFHEGCSLPQLWVDPLTFSHKHTNGGENDGMKEYLFNVD